MGDQLKEKKLTCNIPSLDLPDDWSCIKAEGIGPFVTKAILKHPNGSHIGWASRDHRKHHNLLDSGTKSTLWAPKAIGWWVGVIFAVGAVCFTLGSSPVYPKIVGNNLDGMTFFIGSLFFTTAALAQYIETINARQTPKGLKLKQKIRLFTWEPRRIDWLAVLIQFIGTIFFNISTFYALNSLMTIQQINSQVWTPDVYGSICFLVASGLVWIEVGHSLFSWKIGSLSWQIAALNLIGSIAFGISAISAFILPLTGNPVNITLVNFGTFTGGLCFLIGALLLLPERTHPEKI